MQRFTKLAREGKIGRLCKRGAWIVAAVGTSGLLLQVYSAWEMYRQLQISQPGSPYSDISFFLGNVSYVFGAAINIIFSFLILYVAGAILDSFFLPEKSDITFEPLEDVELAPSGEQVADRRGE
jgi:hypothetical protein